MTQPQDARTLAALEEQSRQLAHILARLESARVALVPTADRDWHGAARNAFDLAVSGLVSTVDAGIAALRSALFHTDRAIAELVYRA